MQQSSPTAAASPHCGLTVCRGSGLCKIVLGQTEINEERVTLGDDILSSVITL